MISKDDKTFPVLCGCGPACFSITFSACVILKSYSYKRFLISLCDVPPSNSSWFQAALPTPHLFLSFLSLFKLPAGCDLSLQLIHLYSRNFFASVWLGISLLEYQYVWISILSSLTK